MANLQSSYNTHNQLMIDLIRAATLSGGNRQQQKTAQSSLISQRNEQPELFLVQCAQILTKNTIQMGVRQAAGALLTVSLKTKDERGFLWDQVSAPQKSAFKDMVLGSMVDREKFVRRAAANVVAAICVIEIPRGEWPGIVEKIAANMSNEDVIVKEVSILTISFICQTLREYSFYFQEALQRTIMTGILLGVKQQTHDIAQTAFKALRDSMPTVPDIVKNQQYRDYMISQIAQAITGQSFIELGLQCLLEFVRFHFVYVTSNYVEGFFKIIQPILINRKDEASCVIATQFWANLAKEEKNIEDNPEMRKFLTGQLALKLVEILLQNLCFISSTDQEGNGISQAAASALQAIFEGNSEPFEKQVLHFTDTTIKNPDEKLRQASIRAFALLLLGLRVERSQELVNLSLVPLVSLIIDPHPLVQRAAVRSFALIAEQVPVVILKHGNFLNILELLMSQVKQSQFFMKNVARIIESLASVEQSPVVLAPYLQTLLTSFISISQNPSLQKQVLNTIFSVILALIKCSRSLPLCYYYIQYVINNFQSIATLEQEKRQAYYSGFFIMVQIALMTVRKIGGAITMDQMSKIYNLVIERFTKINDVQADGYYVISALAYFIPHDRRLVDDFWKYIDHGLKKLTEEEIFKATITCICDLSSIYKTDIVDKVDPILVQILSIYEGTTVSRDIKLDILTCIGELFLQCGEVCYKHIGKLMELMLLSCQGAIELTDVAYGEAVQDEIIETFMCIFHGTEGSALAMLSKYIPYIFQFVKITTDSKRRPKLQYLNRSMMLLGDIASFFTLETRDYIRDPVLGMRVQTLIKYNGDGKLSDSINYVKNQFKIMF